jgi:hypothetical protein
MTCTRCKVKRIVLGLAVVFGLYYMHEPRRAADTFSRFEDALFGDAKLFRSDFSA